MGLVCDGLEWLLIVSFALRVGRDVGRLVWGVEWWLDGCTGDGFACPGWWGCRGGGWGVGMLLRGVVGEVVGFGCGWEG